MMRGANYIYEVLACADDLFVEIGEDEELLEEIGHHLKRIDDAIDKSHAQWAIEWAYQHDGIETIDEFIHSIASLNEIVYEYDNVPDSLMIALGELLTLLEPIDDSFSLEDNEDID